MINTKPTVEPGSGNADEGNGSDGNEGSNEGNGSGDNEGSNEGNGSGSNEGIDEDDGSGDDGGSDDNDTTVCPPDSGPDDDNDESVGTNSGENTGSTDASTTDDSSNGNDGGVPDVDNGSENSDPLGDSSSDPDPAGNEIPVDPDPVSAPDPIVYVSSITITPAAVTMGINDIRNFTVDIQPGTADDQSVTWSVEQGTGDGSVNQHGSFVATKAGTVTVKATANDGSDVVGRAYVTITEPVHFSVTHAGNTVLADGQTSGNIACSPSAGRGDKLTLTVSASADWTVAASDTGWMSVTKSGSYAIVTIGNVADGNSYSSTLTFTMNDKNYTLKSTLMKPHTFRVTHAGDTVLAQGQTSGSIACSPSAGRNDRLTLTVSASADWTVKASDTSWMSVTKSGSNAVVTVGAVADGKNYVSTLTFTMNGQNYTVKVSLNKPHTFSVTHAGNTVLAQGETSGSVACSPSADRNDRLTLTVSASADWTVKASDTSWMSVTKSGSNAIVTVGSVKEGMSYRSTLTFTMNSQTYKVTVSLVKEPVSPVFTASFAYASKTLSLGETWIVDANVSLSGGSGSLGIITINSADLSGSTLTDNFKDHYVSTVATKNWAAYRIDTNKAPWNQPGTYTLRIWAKDTNGTGGDRALATMTLNITNGGVPNTLPLPVLSGNRAQDTAAIAKSQIGYTYSNGTAYGVWWNGVTNWGVDYTKSDWCGMFAAWCANQAGAGLNVAYNKNAAGAGYLLQWCMNNATYDMSFTTTPKPGDYVFFSKYSSGYYGGSLSIAHVAVVTAYSPSTRTITFVGGNQNDQVSQSTVKWNSGYKFGRQYVVAIGRPNY